MSLDTILVFTAGATFFVGYLITNQIWLRLGLFAGTLLYIWYYMIAADTPLWAAVATSSATASANLIGLGILLSRRSQRLIPRAHRDIFSHFTRLSPGDFRKVMRLAERRRITTATVMTREGARPDALWFVLSGETQVTKQGETFALPPLLFTGEVAYLTGKPSVATVVAAPGAEVLSWDLGRLSRRMARDPRLRLAMDAMISADMARKIAQAFPSLAVQSASVVRHEEPGGALASSRRTEAG